jgi:hypothetical protein
VTDFDRPDEVLNDDELQVEFDAGNIRIDISGGQLTSADTTKTLEQSKAIVQPIHDLDIRHNLAGTTAPAAGDDEDDGYAVGSLWVDTTNDTFYVCSDSASGAAVWVGAGGTWAGVLASGNESGGTDAVMTAGDELRGVDQAAATGDDLVMRGGDHTGASGFTFNGGDVVIDGGDTNSTNGNSKGGDVLITAGVASGSSADGGDVVISGGQPIGLGFSGGGSVTLRGADGSTAGGNSPGGDVTIICGDGQTASAAGGDFTVTGGDSPTGTGNAGNISLTAGFNVGAGLANSGGDVSISAGDSNGRSGDVTITSGNNTDTVNTNNAIGNISIGTGTATGTATNWTGGSIDISCNGSTTGGVVGGNLSLSAGDTGTSSQDGGDVAITAGNTFGFNGRQGGHITLTGGTENNGNAFSLGGSVFMIPGTSVSGDPGQVFIQGTGSMAMLERASAAGMGIYVPVAGYGRWWVRNDGPNVPMFTDDAGTDWVLNATGATDLQGAYEGGNTIDVSTTYGTVEIAGTADDATPVMTISSGAHTGPAAGRVLAIDTDNNALGDALFINNIGSGNGLLVQDNGTDNLAITGAGAVAVTPTSGQDCTITTDAAGDVDINAGTNCTIDAAFGFISLDATGASNFTCSSGDLTLSTSDTASPSDVNVTAGTATGATNEGGYVNVTAGGGNTTGDGGQANLAAGIGGLTGNGGKASVVGGAGGGTSGNGGLAVVQGGSVTDGIGGGVNITGVNGVGTNKSGGVVNIDAGNSTGTTAGAAINVMAGDGSVSSVGGAVNIDGGAGRTGGDVVITSGAPLGVLAAGNVRIIAEKSGGAAGQIFLTTESDDTADAPIELNTQSGFSGQGAEHRTHGTSDAVTNGTSNQLVVNIRSTGGNGKNLKVKARVTAVDASDDANVVSYSYEGDFYSSGGTTVAFTAFRDQNYAVGSANFTSNVSFNLGISGSTIRLEVSNAGGSGTEDFTLNITSMFVVQVGGAAS